MCGTRLCCATPLAFAVGHHALLGGEREGLVRSLLARRGGLIPELRVLLRLDARDVLARLPSGAYLARLDAGSETRTRVFIVR